MTRRPPLSPAAATCAALALTFAGAWRSAAQAPAAGPAAAPEPAVAAAARATAERLVAALGGGDPAAWESFAQESFSAAMLARRTPENRRHFAAQVHGELGRMQLVDVVATGPASFLARVRSASGDLRASFDYELETAAPFRIVRLGLEVDQGGGEEPRSELPPLPEVAGLRDPAALAAALDPYLGALAAGDRLSGTVLVAFDGQPLYSRAFGLADRERGVANTAETRHNVASIGKVFTQVAIAQLVAQGKLALTDPVGRHLPAYPNPDGAKATVEQLVRHQGGIANMFDLPPAPEVPKANRDWFAVVAPAPLEFAPGTRSRYCNGCYVVLGEVVAAVSGMPYERYLAEHVFGPAGMTATAFLGFGEGAPGQAVLYTRGPEGLRPPGFRPGMRGSGAGGVYSTAGDLLAFENALRGYRLVDRAGTAWVVGSEGEEVRPGRAAGGLGIAGGSPGTSAVLDGDGRWTVIVLTNRDPRLGEDLGIALARALAR